VHGVDADGQVLIRRQLKRRQVKAFFQKLPSCLVGIEACASWGSSQLFALRMQSRANATVVALGHCGMVVLKSLPGPP
jgi:transposase